MSGFSSTEKYIARLLNTSPRLRSAAKVIYQYLNFLLHQDRGFKLEVNPAMQLSTPSQLIGEAEPENNISEFFGYFDASPWSPNGRYYVAHQVADRSETAEIILYDLEENKRTILASSPAWTWQQGAMARWIIRDEQSYIAFNGTKGRTLGTHIMTPGGDDAGFIDLPLQAVNQTKDKIYCINYLRLGENGTEYGYSLDVDNIQPNQPTNSDGIWQVDLNGSNKRLIVSIETLLNTQPRPAMKNASHEINHISVAPDGERFIFIHRFRGAQGQFSRLYAVRHDGSEIQLLLDDDMVSHYCWLSPSRILTWSRTKAHGDCYHVLDLDTLDIRPFENSDIHSWGDGHPTFSSQANHFVTDSYPDRKRQQHLFMVDPNLKSIKRIGRFLSPMRFIGENRVDMHPRWSPDGKHVSVDASFESRRRNYIIDIDASQNGSA